MRLSLRIGLFLLGVWLVLTGATPLLGITIPSVAMAVLALLAGVCLLWPDSWSHHHKYEK